MNINLFHYIRVQEHRIIACSPTRLWYNSTSFGMKHCEWYGSKGVDKSVYSTLCIEWVQILLCALYVLHCTHRGRDKMAAISHTTFSKAFSWMKMYEFRLRFHWSLFRINSISVFVQIMAWRRPGDKPLSEPMVVILLTHLFASMS